MIGKKINQLATELAPVSTDLTIIGDPISGVSKKITLAQLGAIFSGAVSFYTDLASFPATGDINVIYCAKDTKKLYLWSGSAYVEVFPSQALLDTYQLRSEKGVSNGYASLDSGGKVPISQLPSSIMEYKGTWNASTNTPTLANGTGDTGDVYICNVAGTVNFGAGPLTFAVGDYVIYSGTIWQRSSGAVGTVTSVAATITGDSVTISGSPVTTSGTLAFAFNGTTSQYIRGNGTLATFPSLTGFVPYTGATANVDLGTHTLLAKDLVINHSSGSGVAASITKGGSGEALTVVKSSGSGNAASITGGVTLLDELHLNTDLADAYIASATNWNAAYNDKINSAAVTGTTTKTLTLTQQDGGTITASWTDDNTDAVTSVFGRTGAVVATSGDYTTAQVTESGNLYFTNARAIASTLTGYTSGAGTITSSDSILSAIQKLNGNIGALTTGVSSVNGLTGAVTLTTSNIAEGTNLYYTEARVNANTNVAANTAARHNAVTLGTANGLSLSTQVLSLGLASTSTTGALSSTDWNTFNNKTSNTGTVTSVGLSSATSGVTIGSTPITTSGTITLAIATASGSGQGLLSSTDWTTFNNKQNALTNPVTGTGTTNYLPKFTGASTIGNSAITDDGTTVTLISRALSGTSATFSGNITISAGATNGLILQNSAGGESPNVTFITPVNKYNIDANANGILRFFTENTDGSGGVVRANLDASGNLGLGVTPSASNWATFELLGGNTITSYPSATIPALYSASNAYYNSGWIYKSSNNALMCAINAYSGQFQWFTAPSGTAGNAISFTQAMTLNASGNLSIGNTNDTYKLDVSNGSSNVYIRAITSGSANWATLLLQNGDGSWHVTNDDTGTFNIGTSNDPSAQQKLSIASTGAATFSSSVTAGGALSTYGQLRLEPSAFGSIVVGSRSSQTDFQLYNTGNIFRIYNGSSDALTVNTSGNVGIGTTNPLTDLHISKAGSRTLRITNSTNSTDVELGISTALGYVGTKTDNSFAFNTNDTERMRITSGGNVGLGTTAPNSLLEVNRTITFSSIDTYGQLVVKTTSGANGKLLNIGVDETNSVSFIQSLNRGTDAMPLSLQRYGGNVGINTASPSYNLDVHSSAGGSFSTIRSNNGYTGASDGSQILLGNSANFTNAYFRLNGGGNSSQAGIGSLNIGVTEAVPMAFYTSNSERMRINSSGNVLIGGTSSDYGKLDVTVAPSSYTAALGLGLQTNSGEGNSVGISFKTKISLSGAIWENARIAAFTDAVSSSVYGALAFYTMSATTLSERMRIGNNGFVGIGTTSPNHLLQVTSSSNFGAALKVSDVSTQSTGAIALGDGSSSTLGIGMWRAAENSYTTQGNWLNIQGISGIAFMSGTGAFGSNTKRMTLSSSGNLELTNGTIKTGAPGLGDAGAIRLGQRWGGTAVNAGGYIPIDIDGTTYYINLFSSTP